MTPTVTNTSRQNRVAEKTDWVTYQMGVDREEPVAG